MKKSWFYLSICFIFAVFAASFVFISGKLIESEISSFKFSQIVKSQTATKETEKKERQEIENIKNLQKENEVQKEEFQKEVIDGIVVLYQLDKNLIWQKIKEGKEFLLRMEKDGGFHKYYFALEDEFEERLHTPYSASIVYTFLYLSELEKDEKILEKLPEWGDFLLSMQNKEKKHFGAFHYSIFLENKEKEKKFVVGTSALTIMTLLKLYEFTQNQKYLESAKLAGDWLITMQQDDGKMLPYVRFSDGKWFYGQKESLLYEGQVMTALSRLYLATKEEKYKETAKKIAERFVKKYEKEGGFIQGEYRPKNPISNAWVVMSLMEFYKVKPEEKYKKVIFELADKILKEQRKDPKDPLNYGSFKGVYSSSGVGWISEVMTELFRFCKKEREENCQKYKDSVISSIRWLIGYTYSKENSQNLKNPERAQGGIFWSKDKKYVRTDSVCHALNSYIRIFEFLEDDILLSLK